MSRNNISGPSSTSFNRSRRSLLGAAAAGTTLPWLGSCTSIRRAMDPAFATLYPERGRVLRVGLVGCGGRGTGAALQALLSEERPDPPPVEEVVEGEMLADEAQVEPPVDVDPLPYTVQLVAMGDAFEERITSSHDALIGALGPARSNRVDVPAQRRFTGFDAYQRVIDSGVDVVLLCTPPGFRPVQLAYAVAANCHVFCEKPMAVDVPGLRSVMDSARDAKDKGLSLVAGFCWRYKSGHRAFYEQLRRGAIGDVRSVYTNYNTGWIGTHPREAGWSDVEWQLRNWHHFDWLSGSHLVEQACHSLDMQAWAFEDRAPLAVTAVGGCTTREGELRGNCFDHYAATFEYEGDVKAFHMSRQWSGSDGENNTFVSGALGQGILENWTPRYEFTGKRGWVFEGEHNDMYQQEHDELFASIRDAKPLNDGQRMASSTMLALMARMAATTGKRVTWEQALQSEQRLGPEELAFGPFEPRPMPVPGSAPEPEVTAPGVTAPGAADSIEPS